MNPDTASRASSQLLTLYEGHPLAGKAVDGAGDAAIPTDAHHVATRAIEGNIERMVTTIRAQANFHDPSHGTVMLKLIMGVLDSAIQRRDSDPVLQAIFVNDRISQLRGYINHLEKWSTFYSSLGPDEVEPTGADKCL